MNQNTDTSSIAPLAGEVGLDPIEERLQSSVRATIEALFEEELALFLGRLSYGPADGPAKGYRRGHRQWHRARQLTGTFGTGTVRLPQGRIGPWTKPLARHWRPWRVFGTDCQPVHLGMAAPA